MINVMIGPGKAFDTDRYYVVSPNLLGSCYGTTGPASIDPASGQSYGAEFPDVTVEDIASSGYYLMRELGVSRLHAAVGSSKMRIDGFLIIARAIEIFCL